MPGVITRADEVLRRFFEERSRAASPRLAARLATADVDLRGCLDALAPLLLDPHERALLALERQFDAEGAAERVLSAASVLLALPVFLDEPRWHGRDLTDRRLRIVLASELAEAIALLPAPDGLDVGRAVGVVDASVRHEIWMLRQERAAARRR